MHRSPNVIPVEVEDSRGFHPGEDVVIEGTRYHVVGVDDSTSTIFLELPGKRKERRDAFRTLTKVNE